MHIDGQSEQQHCYMTIVTIPLYNLERKIYEYSNIPSCVC